MLNNKLKKEMYQKRIDGHNVAVYKKIDGSCLMRFNIQFRCVIIVCSKIVYKKPWFMRYVLPIENVMKR